VRGEVFFDQNLADTVNLDQNESRVQLIEARSLVPAHTALVWNQTNRLENRTLEFSPAQIRNNKFET
jgi:hypothetical protein